MLGLPNGPHMTSSITLYQFLGYCLLAIAAVLALRVLVDPPAARNNLMAGKALSQAQATSGRDIARAAGASG